MLTSRLCIPASFILSSAAREGSSHHNSPKQLLLITHSLLKHIVFTLPGNGSRAGPVYPEQPSPDSGLRSPEELWRPGWLRASRRCLDVAMNMGLESNIPPPKRYTSARRLRAPSTKTISVGGCLLHPPPHSILKAPTSSSKRTLPGSFVLHAWSQTWPHHQDSTSKLTIGSQSQI